MAAKRSSGNAGLGLGAKSALIVAGISALFLVVQTLVATSSAKRSLEAQAIERGYAVVLRLAAAGSDGWFVEQKGKLLARAGSQARLKTVLASGARSAWISGPKGATIRLHKGEFQGSDSGGKRGPAQFVRGSWGAGRQGRLFQAQLLAKNGTPSGYANAFFDEALFVAGEGNPSVMLWIISLLGIVGGLVAGFLASGLYTKPLRELAHAVSRLSRGNLNYRSQHRGSDELGRLSRALETMCDTLAEGEEAQERLGQVEEEAALLGELQTAMQPKEIPSTEGFEAVAVQLRGLDSGSDLYDAVPLEGGRLALFVASTSARGALGALLAGMTRAYLRSALERNADVAEALRSTNRNLAAGMRKGMHVTCQVAVLDSEKGSATVYIAGHRAPFYACRGGEVSVVHGEGLALGLDAGAVFDRRLEEVVVDMPQGTRIVLTTVGTYAFEDQQGVEFGVERFQELVRKQAPKNSEAFLNLVLGTLDMELGEEERLSDATIVTAKRML